MVPRRTIVGKADLVGELDRCKQLERGQGVEPKASVRREEKLRVSDVPGIDVLQPERGDDEVLDLFPQRTLRVGRRAVCGIRGVQEVDLGDGADQGKRLGGHEPSFIIAEHLDQAGDLGDGRLPLKRGR
jgi:hypothetical protein